MSGYPRNLNGFWPTCPYCYATVQPLFVDDCVKECHGPGSHTIGWNGQLWIPAVLEFCNIYGLTLKSIEENKKKHAEQLSWLLK